MTDKPNPKDLIAEFAPRDSSSFKEIRKETETTKDATAETKITEDIQLKNELFQVKGALKKNITADYTLAYISKDEREFITENYQNAEYAKNILERFGEKGWRYEWDENLMDWKRDENNKPIKVQITNDEIKIINRMALRTFEFFMVRPHMIAILGRNRSENFLVRLLGKHKDDDEEETPVGMMPQQSFLDKIKGAFNREEVEYVD